MNKNTDDREFVVRVKKYKKGKLYVIIYPMEKEIWIDAAALPNSTFFCACCDNVTIKIADVGKREKENRYFLPLEWLVNEWGGEKKIIETLKILKSNIIDNIEEDKNFLLSKASCP